jgi:hypothetical protein
MTTDTVSLLVIDTNEVLFGTAIGDWDAITLLACLSDDPDDWGDVQLIWPRYQTELSGRFVDSLPLAVCDLPEALAKIDAQQPWLAVDLVQRRVVSGGGYGELSRSETFGVEEDGKRICIPVRLSRVWELIEEAQPNAVQQDRKEALARAPETHRQVLWGEEWLFALATLMVKTTGTTDWSEAVASPDQRVLYKLTMAVHRAWLMTRRADLSNFTPRDCLLSGREWIDELIDARRFSGMETQLMMVPLHEDTTAYRCSPMGTIEIVLYFDCNRAVIEKGWDWLRANIKREDLLEPLIEFMTSERDLWLHTMQEDPETPAQCISSERQRIPLVSSGGHIIDCDCPVCVAMATGEYGPSFVMFDGHHLELDGDFAFSLCDDYEEWKWQNHHHAEMAEEFAANRNPKQDLIASTAPRLEKGDSDADEFQSAWQNSYVNWDSIRGTPMEQMALSFLLADMVTTLQMADKKSPDIKRLNVSFADYRTVFVHDRAKATQQFKATLDEIAERNPELVTRTADLQSKLDELCRRTVS